MQISTIRRGFTKMAIFIAAVMLLTVTAFAAVQHLNSPTRPIVYQGYVVGFEATEYAEDVMVEPIPFTSDYGNELLADIYYEMGNIMWPTYLPEGFVLSESGILNPRDFTSFPELFTDGCYKHLNELMAVFSDDDRGITLSVQLFQPYSWYGGDFIRMTADDLPTLNYTERLITINGMNATIGLYTGLILRDIDAGASYQFLAHGAVSEEKLINMAESLTNILDLMQ